MQKLKIIIMNLGKNFLIYLSIFFFFLFLFILLNQAVKVNQTLSYIYFHGGNGSLGYSNLNSTSLNDSQIKNISLTGWKCVENQCNFTLILDNDNYQKVENSFNLTNFTGPIKIYYESGQKWRPLEELNSVGQGNWSIERISSLRTRINYTLAGADGFDYGIKDVLEGGSYWLESNGSIRTSSETFYPKFIWLKNDFIEYAAEIGTQEGVITYNYIIDKDGNEIFDFIMSWGGIKLNGEDFGNIYHKNFNSNPKVYFFDWKSSKWKIWQKGVNNATHGMPDWLDPRFKQAFKWRYQFKRENYPEINFTFLLTAHDPFIRIFVDSYNQTGTSNLTIPLNFEEKSYLSYYNGSWIETNKSEEISLNISLLSFYEKSSSTYVLFSTLNLKNISIKVTNTSSVSLDQLIYSYNFDNSNYFKNQHFLFSLGYATNVDTTSGNPSTWQIGFSDETLESLGNSTLTYYDILSHSKQLKDQKVEHNFTLQFHYNETYKDYFEVGAYNYFGIEDSDEFTGNYIASRTQTISHKIVNASSNYVLFNLTDHDSFEQTDYDQRKILITGYLPRILISIENLNSTIETKAKRGDTVKFYVAVPSDAEPKLKANLIFPNGSSIQLNLTSNLVGYWSFDEGSGNIAHDYSGNGNDGTLSDANVSNSDGNTLPKWVDGKFGKALEFDGVDDYVKGDLQLVYGPNNLTESTWIAWFKMKSLPSTTYFYKIFGTNVHDMSIYVREDGKVGFRHQCNTYLDADYASIGEWTFFAASVKYLSPIQINYLLFINGEVIKGTRTSTNLNITRSFTQFRIGDNSIWRGIFFNGTIDEVRIYNRTLTATEIKALYEQGYLYAYETSYTFQPNDPEGNYTLKVIDDSLFSNSTSLPLSAKFVITLESDKMNEKRRIISRPNIRIKVYGKMFYEDLTPTKALVSLNYNGFQVLNQSDSNGNYLISFSVPYEGIYDLKVLARDEFNNTAFNSTPLWILTSPLTSTYFLSFKISTDKSNDNYTIGTSPLTQGSFSNEFEIVKSANELNNYYVCTFSPNKNLLIALAHSYAKKDLEWIGLNNSLASPSYTLSLKNSLESKLIIPFTQGDCQNIESKYYLIRKQVIPAQPFTAFSFKTPETLPLIARLKYETIDIISDERFGKGSYRLCISYFNVSQANLPQIRVERC